MTTTKKTLFTEWPILTCKGGSLSLKICNKKKKNVVPPGALKGGMRSTSLLCYACWFA